MKKVKLSLHDIVFKDPNLKSNDQLTEDLGMEKSHISTPNNETSEFKSKSIKDPKTPGQMKNARDSIRDQQK